VSARHFDGTLCDGGGFNPPVFEYRITCPLCNQNAAAFNVEEAAGFLRNIATNFNCPEAFALSETLKGIHARVERMTWQKKGGAK